jgi:hypothetical protein
LFKTQPSLLLLAKKEKEKEKKAGMLGLPDHKVQM